MAKQQNNASKTNAQKVRKQNQASQQGQPQPEFASETDAQEVRKQNQQAESRKKNQ
ncbi:small acid-soluble spore protein E (minor gamma-type SASP) [Geomicrobium halophilum]|uniref:Small, acid-soluble spore protein gamma-type n=1 Tax=Geomicrobium halophilum TaxID=549000 RepID=A0A841PR78_9BACL|nr:gamma-type small acid-soluble spore protein [Geomicrobium halophilum]MBB6450314.1 small acid-soluble spore protein E (minor gamma-type SASP) [Geomicrobium halophilum]